MAKNYGYKRRDPYKEDSTKGGALLNPKTYKGDVLVQLWIDSRILATLSNWLDNGGMVTRFMSDVVRTTLEQVVEHLKEQGEVEMVELCRDARDLLKRKYRVDLNPGGKGGRNKLHNLTLDERRKRNREVDVRQSSYTDEQLNRAMEKYDVEKRIEDAKRRAEEVRKKWEVDENGVVQNTGRPYDVDPNTVNIEEMKVEKKKEDKSSIVEVSVKKEKEKRESGVPKQKTEEEIEDHIDRIAKKDKEYEEKLKRM